MPSSGQSLLGSELFFILCDRIFLVISAGCVNYLVAEPQSVVSCLGLSIRLGLASLDNWCVEQRVGVDY